MGAVYLVRHGQASFGAQNYDQLSELGREQSKVVGEQLHAQGVGFVRVLCGTMSRQRDSASAAGFSAEEDPRWNEYDHQAVLAAHGSADGGNITESGSRSFQAALDSGLYAWVCADETSDAGESWTDFCTRVNSALDEVVGALGKGQNALVFTSGGVIGAVAARYIAGQAGGFLALHRVTCNAGITKVVRGRSGTSLVSFNEHGHLEGTPGLLTYR